MGIIITVYFDRESPGKFDARTLSRETREGRVAANYPLLKVLRSKLVHRIVATLVLSVAFTPKKKGAPKQTSGKHDIANFRWSVSNNRKPTKLIANFWWSNSNSISNSNSSSSSNNDNNNANDINNNNKTATFMACDSTMTQPSHTGCAVQALIRCTIRIPTMQYSTLHYTTLHYNTLHYNTILYYTILD